MNILLRVRNGNPRSCQGLVDLQISRYRSFLFLLLMHSQKVMRWLSKNFALQGLVVFQG